MHSSSDRPPLDRAVLCAVGPLPKANMRDPVGVGGAPRNGRKSPEQAHLPQATVSLVTDVPISSLFSLGQCRSPQTTQNLPLRTLPANTANKFFPAPRDRNAGPQWTPRMYTRQLSRRDRARSLDFDPPARWRDCCRFLLVGSASGRGRTHSD